MLNRRQVIQFSATLMAAPSLIPNTYGQTSEHAAVTHNGNALPLIRRAIPSTQEKIPVIGMGTSRTFDTGEDAAAVNNLTQVMRAFINGGGTVIDSSPMYGKAESRVGDVLESVLKNYATPPQLFAATKVWTYGKEKGVAQMQESAERMRVKQFGLVAVHNLRDWKVHLETLQRAKEEGKVRHIGITTSHGRSHTELLDIMRNESLDFVQFSYNIADRTAEERLLPLAAERGIATMINRPFQRGELFSRTRGEPLPAMAQELGCNSWGQFFLKFILAHPAVTCIIPASAKAHHMADNMGANIGHVPNSQQRMAMLRAFESI